MVIQQGRLSDDKTNTLQKDDLLNIIRFGVNAIFASKDADANFEFHIEIVLKMGEEKTTEQKEKLDELAEPSKYERKVAKYAMDSIFKDAGRNEQKAPKAPKPPELPKRKATSECGGIE